MREIKFRAWDKVNKKMILNFAHVGKNGQMHVGYGLSEEYEVMQFTGLYDVNKTPIYEGDIIECITREGKTISPVEWGTATGSWCLPDADGVYYIFDVIKTIEVIGNVFENSELLK